MRIFGLEISRSSRQRNLTAPAYPVYSPNLWTNIFGSISEANTGDWQRNISTNQASSLLKFSPIYSCVTGIAGDISKLRIKLCREQDGIWEEITENSPWLPLLRKPNHYQTTLQFVEQWIMMKLLYGNTYVGKERDARGVVNALYVLDPSRVTPLVADNGDVFYRLGRDYLSQITDDMPGVPASEIIHDRMQAWFHPLIGTPPLYACAMSAEMGATIQADSKTFFANRSMPGGMLTAPGRISDETAVRMKTSFEEKFSGANIGRLFVAGDGLEYTAIRMTAEQSELVEQLKWSVSDVARAFHYPEFKLGGPLPPYSSNMQALILSYFTDCLQVLIEAMESCLDDGLELPPGQGTELDVDNLLRMDSQGQAEVVTKLVGGGVMAPNDGRKKFNLPPVRGGATPYLQEQNYSLEALAKRDVQEDPFDKKTPAAPAQTQKMQESRDIDLTDDQAKLARFRFREKLSA